MRENSWPLQTSSLSIGLPFLDVQHLYATTRDLGPRPGYTIAILSGSTDAAHVAALHSLAKRSTSCPSPALSRKRISSSHHPHLSHSLQSQWTGYYQDLYLVVADNRISDATAFPRTTNCKTRTKQICCAVRCCLPRTFSPALRVTCPNAGTRSLIGNEFECCTPSSLCTTLVNIQHTYYVNVRSRKRHQVTSSPLSLRLEYPR